MATTPSRAIPQILASVPRIRSPAGSRGPTRLQPSPRDHSRVCSVRAKASQRPLGQGNVRSHPWLAIPGSPGSSPGEDCQVFRKLNRRPIATSHHGRLRSSRAVSLRPSALNQPRNRRNRRYSQARSRRSSDLPRRGPGRNLCRPPGPRGLTLRGPEPRCPRTTSNRFFLPIRSGRRRPRADSRA